MQMCVDCRKRRAAPPLVPCAGVEMEPPRSAARRASRADRAERVKLDGRAVGEIPSGLKRSRRMRLTLVPNPPTALAVLHTSRTPTGRA